MHNPVYDKDIPLPEQWEIPAEQNPDDITPEDCGVPAKPDARSAPATTDAPSLDTKCQNPTKEVGQSPQQKDEGLITPARERPSPKVDGDKKPTWNRKQKRAYYNAMKKGCIAATL